ncbi:MAG: c-type cytochrome biogenesis protein CcmI/CycH [bacterium]
MSDEEKEKPAAQPGRNWFWIAFGIILLVMLLAILKKMPQSTPENRLKPLQVGGQVMTPGMQGWQQEAAQRAATRSSGKTISGTVSVADAMKSRVKPDAVLYVIARLSGVKKSPVIAVAKLEVSAFPVNYSLSDSNLMMSGATLEGKFDISARHDQDGDAGTRQIGDLTGQSKKNPVEPGATGADIVLDTEITENYAPPSHPGGL